MSGRALLMDYGGVLTGPVAASFAAWERAHGIDAGRSFEALLEASRSDDGGVIGALERGELQVEEFDDHLRALLRAAGHEVPIGSLLEGLFAGMVPDGRLWDVVARARRAGVPTGLLSNSWGTASYPREELDEHFDEIVISGEVGLRKPDPAIYHLAARRLGVEVEACVFVDDLEANVEVARRLGMDAVLHAGDDRATIAALRRLLPLEPLDEDQATGT